MEKSLRLLDQLREGARRHREFLLPRDHDQVEEALAMFMESRREVEQLIKLKKAHDAELAGAAQHCKLRSDTRLVLLSVQDPVLWRALNQSFPRANIPQGSCDRILHEVTASKLASAGSGTELHGLINQRGWLFPGLENELRHARPIELLVSSGSTISGELLHAQQVMATKVVRIKSPIARPLTTTTAQREEIRRALEPGDVLLSYTAGLVSNMLIPGKFKHASTFVGTENERRQLGLSSETLLTLAAPSNQRLPRALEQKTIDGGHVADVVEALSEGVLFNNLDQMITSRVNLLAVLRPALAPCERALQMIDVLSSVGGDFDFSFDLADASSQVCTEVVYRSLQGRGGIDIPLSKYAGRLTLTPDGIAQCSLRSDGQQLRCLLIVEQSPDLSGNARLLYADEAQMRLAQILQP